MTEIRSLGYHEQALRLCIDGAQGDRVWGRVVSMRLSRPVAFVDLSDFIIKMDAVMDAQSFPQAFQRARAFKTQGKGRSAAPGGESTSGDSMTAREVEAARGELATLEVRVLTRQNASWQGHVAIPGGPEVQRFESELGFMAIVLKYLGNHASMPV